VSGDSANSAALSVIPEAAAAYTEAHREWAAGVADVRIAVAGSGAADLHQRLAGPGTGTERGWPGFATQRIGTF
jgi:hypothetical protein